MKAKVIGLVLTVVALNGCASTGPASNDGPSVPVFRIGQETPCEYESLGRIVAEATMTSFSERDYELAMNRELGRAGSKIGADAVIAEDPIARLPFAVGQVRQHPPSPSLQRRVEFEGEAVRWIEGTCRRYVPEALPSLSG